MDLEPTVVVTLTNMIRDCFIQTRQDQHCKTKPNLPGVCKNVPGTFFQNEPGKYKNCTFRIDAN